MRTYTIFVKIEAILDCPVSNSVSKKGRKKGRKKERKAGEIPGIQTTDLCPGARILDGKQTHKQKSEDSTQQNLGIKFERSPINSQYFYHLKIGND